MPQQLYCLIKNYSAMSNCSVDRFEQIVDVGERFQLEVSGRSMLPFLGYDGDKIVVRRIADDEDVRGRIVLCRVGDKHYVVHRVISNDGGMITMRGDGRLICDKPMSRKCAIGIVEGVVRKNGKLKSCGTHYWRFCERLWLWQPMVVRRCLLGVLRRCMDIGNKNK